MCLNPLIQTSEITWNYMFHYWSGVNGHMSWIVIFSSRISEVWNWYMWNYMHNMVGKVWPAKRRNICHIWATFFEFIWDTTFLSKSDLLSGSFICLLSVFLQDKKEPQFSQYFGLIELLDILNSILYTSRILNFKKNLKGKGWELSFYLWIFTLFKDLSHHDISFLLSGFAPLRWRRHGKTFLQESLK